MFVTKPLRYGWTDFYKTLCAYRVGQRIGQHLSFISLNDKSNPRPNFLFYFPYKTTFAGSASNMTNDYYLWLGTVIMIVLIPTTIFTDLLTVLFLKSQLKTFFKSCYNFIALASTAINRYWVWSKRHDKGNIKQLVLSCFIIFLCMFYFFSEEKQCVLNAIGNEVCTFVNKRNCMSQHISRRPQQTR